MARQRAGQAAAAAFGRVGTAVVDDLPASDTASEKAGISASENDSESANIGDGISARPAASHEASPRAGSSAGRQAGGKTGKKAGKRRRRVGRPRGPERVPLTVRILAQNDARLTAAVEETGRSPQYIVDAALAAYFDGLGIAAAREEARVR